MLYLLFITFHSMPLGVLLAWLLWKYLVIEFFQDIIYDPEILR